MRYALNWQNNLAVSLASTKCIVITGNIHDGSFCIEASKIDSVKGDEFFATPILKIIRKIVSQSATHGGGKYDEFVVYNPQLREIVAREGYITEKNEDGIEDKLQFSSIDNSVMNYDTLINVSKGCGRDAAYCLVIELYNLDSLRQKQEVYNRILTLFKNEEVNPQFTLIVLDTSAPEVEANEDLATPFVKQCPFAKKIEISKPTDDVIKRFLKNTVCRDGDKTSSDSVVSTIVGLTDGFYGIQYRDFAHFFKSYRDEFIEQGGKVDINDRLFFEGAVDNYTNGARENKWDKSMIDFNARSKEFFSEENNKHIVGQNKVKRKVSDSLRKAVQGFGLGADGNNIRGCLVFAGPTGTGKTHTARKMATAMFDSEDYLIRVDMANFQDEIGVNSLLGVGAGYVGHDSTPQFIRDLKEKGSAILLFDEFEKAHPKMFDIFLQMLDSGYITDHATGTRTSLKDIFIVMTTNKGAMLENEDEVKNAIESFFTDKVNRPEIFGRIGRSNVLVFERLNKKDFYKMFKLEFKKTEGVIRNRYPGIKFDEPNDETAKRFVDENWEEDLTDKEKSELADRQNALYLKYENDCANALALGRPLPDREDYLTRKARGISDLGGRGLKDKMYEIIYTEISKALSDYEISTKDFNRNNTLHVSAEYQNEKLVIRVRKEE